MCLTLTVLALVHIRTAFTKQCMAAPASSWSTAARTVLERWSGKQQHQRGVGLWVLATPAQSGRCVVTFAGQRVGVAGVRAEAAEHACSMNLAAYLTPAACAVLLVSPRPTPTTPVQPRQLVRGGGVLCFPLSSRAEVGMEGTLCVELFLQP